MINFTTSKNSVLEVLKYMKAGLKIKSKGADQIFCEVTITNGNFKLASHGYTHSLRCENQRVAKFTMPMFYFEDVVRKHTDKMLKFEVEKNWIKLGSTNFHVNMSLIEDDSILRTIDLPRNYTDKELFQLPYKGYTIEELEFNNLFPKIQAARVRLETNIEKAFRILSKYGFRKEEIERIVRNKLKDKSETKVP